MLYIFQYIADSKWTKFMFKNIRKKAVTLLLLGTPDNA